MSARVTCPCGKFHVLYFCPPSLTPPHCTGCLVSHPVYRNPLPGIPGNLTTHGTGPGNWLAGIDIDSFNGSTVAERVARAAASIDADVLSPVVVAYASTVNDPSLKGYIAFTNKTMVDVAHGLGMLVKPWTSK